MVGEASSVVEAACWFVEMPELRYELPGLELSGVEAGLESPTPIKRWTFFMGASTL